MKVTSTYSNAFITIELGPDLSPYKKRYSEYEVTTADFIPLGNGFSNYQVYAASDPGKILDTGYISIPGDTAPDISVPGTDSTIVVFN
jgi:hypothetical protein